MFVIKCISPKRTAYATVEGTAIDFTEDRDKATRVTALEAPMVKLAILNSKLGDKTLGEHGLKIEMIDPELNKDW